LLALWWQLNHIMEMLMGLSFSVASLIYAACHMSFCKRLDRMEITGARWGLEGGEAVLTLRALAINGDLDAYWEFHETQEYQRHHQAKFAEMPPARPPLKLVSRGKNG